MTIKNPNFISKNRLAARAAKRRKQKQKAQERAHLRNIGGEEAQKDARRGARPGLLPTSGPRAAISKKKLRKLERMRGHVERRKREMEAAFGIVGDGTMEVDEEAVKGKEEGNKGEVEMDVE
ncbi:hypothetical protein VTJ04DRAFT_7721 [Mycothermus thermophilus]|uniref:uncharacterized protein n=1 Tax=Humicola insolens TaxID=85995 RepID=UPI00374341C1